MELSLNDAALGQCFNVGSNVETSILGAGPGHEAGWAALTTSLSSRPHLEVFGPSYEDIPRRIPKVERIAKVIGWKATTPLDEGLASTIEFYRKP